MDKTTASFFYENGFFFNVADSSSFANIVEESMRFAKQNTDQIYKTPSGPSLKLERLSARLGSSLTKNTSQLSNL